MREWQVNEGSSCCLSDKEVARLKALPRVIRWSPAIAWPRFSDRCPADSGNPLHVTSDMCYGEAPKGVSVTKLSSSQSATPAVPAARLYRGERPSIGQAVPSKGLIMNHALLVELQDLRAYQASRYCSTPRRTWSSPPPMRRANRMLDTADRRLRGDVEPAVRNATTGAIRRARALCVFWMTSSASSAGAIRFHSLVHATFLVGDSDFASGCVDADTDCGLAPASCARGCAGDECESLCRPAAANRLARCGTAPRPCVESTR